jgi:hypothetical protein
MAYSGTVGNTVINVQTLIEHGARRCGKLAEELTDEQVISAKESLFFLLINLSNIGINYWAIDKTVIGLNVDQYIYDMPVGTIDILNALYRTCDRPTGTPTSSAGGTVANAFDGDTSTYCQQSSPLGNISIDYGAGQTNYVFTIGFMPYIAGGGSQTWSYVFEASPDGATWTNLYTGTAVSVTDSQWVWQDITNGQNMQYYRMRMTSGTLSVRELYFGTNPREIQMSRLNRDDYTNLPNKGFLGNNPYQYWFDRTIPRPTAYLWPVPNTAFVQVTVWRSRQIMDIGQLSNELEVPQRWYEAVVMMLAHRMSLELPAVDMARVTYLEGQAEKYLTLAEMEERDKSPIYFAPNIAGYTR